MNQSLNSDIPWTHEKRKDLSAWEGQGFSPFSWWDVDVPARPPTPILVYPRSFVACYFLLQPFGSLGMLLSLGRIISLGSQTLLA